MRKLGSYFVILLLITAYGRCMADQFGVLHSTDSSCCQVTCNAESHCADEPPSDDHDSESEESDEPTPCQLCFILSSDSILLGDSIDVPSPTLLELTPAFFHSGLGNFSDNGLTVLDLDQPTADHPDPPEEHRSRLQRTVAKLTPVRGPSIV